MGPLAKEALRLFYKKFGKRIANTVAESKWIADKIKELSKKTQKVATKVRKDLKNLGVGTKDRPYPGFIPKIVKNKWTDRHGKTWIRDEKGRPIQITEGLGKYKLWKAAADVKRSKLPESPKTVTNKSGKVFEEKVIGPAKVIYGRFPKKLPRKPKADGGSIDKSLPGRSRDI